MNSKVLLVDDEPNILTAFKRQLRRDFEIETAGSGDTALEKLEEDETFAVVVSDMRMPEMDGAQLLLKVSKRYPLITRIMLTGNNDHETAVRAVNEGRIFRFLNKPISSESLAQAIHDGLEYHRIKEAEHELLHETLAGSIKVLTNILSLVDPQAFGKCTKVRDIANEFAEMLELEDSWELDLAATFSSVGKVVLPRELILKLEYGEQLTPKEEAMLHNIPKTSSELISHLPRLRGAAEIIRYSRKNFDGKGFPEDDVKEEKIPLGSRVLRIAADFHTLRTKGISEEKAFSQLRAIRGRHDPQLLERIHKAFKIKQGVREESEVQIHEITPGQLCAGQILQEDVHTADGVLLVTQGTRLSSTHVSRIQNYSELIGLKTSLKVDCMIPTGEDEELVSEDEEARAE
jgi:response regulator RpfG family c-di-GMP phosphodiesterase